VVTRHPESVEHISAHFVTAWADARSDRGGEPFGPDAVQRLQRLDPRDHGALRRAAPARVDGRHVAARVVGEQDWNAIGHANRDRR